MKLLIDMNLSPKWVAAFVDNGIEAVHWSNLGKPDAPDFEILAYAARHGYAVFTNDLDFSAILAANQGDKPSVVQVRGDALTVDGLLPVVLQALKAASVELEAGALLTLDAQRSRVRILPLRRSD